MDQFKKQAADRAAQKKMRESRKANGLCYKCGKHSPAEGRAKCSICLGIQKDSHHARKMTLVQQSRCTKCGGKREASGAFCETCFLKGRALRHFGSSENFKLLKEIFKREGGVCPYTGRKLVLGVNAALDHKIPKMAGGDNSKENLQWVYIPANNAKWHMAEEEFLELIREIHRFRFISG